MNKNKSIVFGLPMLVLVIILHFITFMIIDGMVVGLVSGLSWAFGAIILTGFATMVYTLLTAKKEKLFTMYGTFLAFYVIGVIITKIYMTYI